MGGRTQWRHDVITLFKLEQSAHIPCNLLEKGCHTLEGLPYPWLHSFPFNVKATRWLGICPDSRPGFSEHVAISTRKARTAERRLSSMVARHGAPPLSARHLQEAIVGSTLMYGSEVVWKGQKSMCRT